MAALSERPMRNAYDSLRSMTTFVKSEILLRQTQGHVHGQIVAHVVYYELGAPAEPCRVDCRGTSVDVKQKDIIAAGSNPAAVFTATQIRPHIGQPYYVSGKVEFPENAPREAKVA